MIPARENPFSSERIESLAYRHPDFRLETIIERMVQRGWRGAIVGGHGTGKTTLLIELARFLEKSRIEGEDYPVSRLWFIPRRADERRRLWPQMIRAANSGELLLVDGIEKFDWGKQLKLVGLWPQVHRVLKTARNNSIPSGSFKVIATAHRWTGLPSLARCETDLAILRDLVLELHPGASRALLREAQELFRSKRGNIRDVFWNLYDCCSDEDAVQRIEDG